MVPARINRRVVGDRLRLAAEYIAEIQALPLADRTIFLADRRNAAAAESYLRRALEALLDIGRHILAKGFATGVSEYKEIATRLRDAQVLTAQESSLLFTMAGYRNRVDFYHEITPDELYSICTSQLGEVEQVADAYRRWVNAHPELMSDEL
ncbi:MAG TPA: DUF86 domain-containing protein [Roseiflexaceae bacterium]|nr:DUF86 domain-containing protein [Roseiflexaceae bacterium]